jgi:ParB-like chromosome segregation protein Spo0J
VNVSQLAIRYVSPKQLKPYGKNARTHNPAQITQIAASIQEFGWTNPILTDGKGGIVAGHGRLEAAQQLGLTQVPVIELPHLTAKQRRMLVVADNKLALNAGWDDRLLSAELAALGGIDTELTGFSKQELASIFGEDEAVLVPVELKPPPKMVWVLLGIPIAEYGEVQPQVATLERCAAISVQSTRN